MSPAVAPGSTKGAWTKFVKGFAPSKWIAGGVVSRTIIRNVLLVPVPAAAAVTVTVLVPSGKVEPETGLFVVVRTSPARLVAEVLKFTIAPEGPVASAVIVAGTVMIGGGKTVLLVSTVNVLLNS